MNAKLPTRRVRRRNQRHIERAVRRRNLARSMDLTWESLRSHLADAVLMRHRDAGGEEWEARCVREYAEIIYALAVELHELTKVDFKIRAAPHRAAI